MSKRNRRKRLQPERSARRVEEQRSSAGRLPGGIADMVQLQSEAGNRALVSLLARSGADQPAQMNDSDTDEADRRGFVLPGTAPPPRSGGKKIPAQLRAEMERSFDTGFGHVRIHQNEDMADDLGAVAFTVGNDIHFGAGGYQPHSGRGRRVIAHELTHVVQQRSGRVRSPGGEGLPVNTEHSLESEAERVGRHAAWRMPVGVRGARSGVHRPVGVAAQAYRDHSRLRSSPAE